MSDMPMVGIEWYKKGTAVFPVYFPHGLADCRHCSFLRNVEHIALHRCALTEALIERGDLGNRHPLCPVKFEEKENEE